MRPWVWHSSCGRGAAEKSLMASSTHRDPRSIITPDAFEVADSLIGMPLASPRRRAVALLIDGIVIGFITVVTKSFALILGVVAAAFFMRAGFKRTKVRNSVFGRAMRFSVGCLGIVIAAVTAVLWVAFGPDIGRDGEASPARTVASVISSAGTVFAGVEALGLLSDVENAGSFEEVRGLGRELVRSARAQGLDEETVRATLLALTLDDPAWADRWAEAVDEFLAEEYGSERPVAETDPTNDADARAAALTDGEALAEYASLLEDTDSDPAYRAALEGRLATLVAADTLASLEARSDQQARQLGASEAALAEAEAELAESSGGGLFGWLLTRLDELGFGFGWAAIYMSVFLSWWNGQTVGKRIMGVRVVRLDGEPITWWTAFERAGGYAAGLATGLLGFAQVWWDANRQAIHDRIVGTVVVRDGAKKVADWESAL